MNCNVILVRGHKIYCPVAVFDPPMHNVTYVKLI